MASPNPAVARPPLIAASRPTKPAATPCKTRIGPTPFGYERMNAELISKTPATKVAHAIAGNAGDLSVVDAEAVALMRGTLG